MDTRFSWKCPDCGETSRREPHWRLDDHMAQRHNKRWAGEGVGFIMTDASREAMRSEIIKIAAAMAIFQHSDVSELDQDDMPQFGEFAHRLKKVADKL